MTDATYGLPGFATIKETQEAVIGWGPEVLRIYGSGVIAAATVDSANTPTTLLRPGLVLGKITASGKYTQYSATATDGSQVAVGVLPIGLRMTDIDGTTGDRNFAILLAGPIKAGSLIGLDNIARAQMARSFLFDDQLPNLNAFGGGMLKEVSKAANYTVVAADNGTLFTAITGAVTFTLPTLAAGLRFEFLNLVDANMTIASAGSLDDIVWMNDLAADSLAASTVGQKIGARLQFEANAAGTKWYVRNLSPAGVTITAA